MSDLIKRGDLVRWIVDYESFAADDVGMVYPYDPIYEYGIVIEVSQKDSNCVVIYNPKNAEWCLGDLRDKNLEIISKARDMSKENIEPVEVITLNTGTKDHRWLCIHCKWGMVNRLPAECPECGRLLSEEVKRRDE